MKNCEILIDTCGVNIPLSRYDELVRAEINLKMIKELYHSDIASYDYEKFLSMVFGKKGAEENAE